MGRPHYLREVRGCPTQRAARCMGNCKTLQRLNSKSPGTAHWSRGNSLEWDTRQLHPQPRPGRDARTIMFEFPGGPAFRLFQFLDCGCPVLAILARARPELAEGAGTMLLAPGDAGEANTVAVCGVGADPSQRTRGMGHPEMPAPARTKTGPAPAETCFSQ
jgi:hypothetical protein